MSSKPYDDAFKTLVYECTPLLVPIVNKFFGRRWPRGALVVADPNEYLRREGDDDMITRYLDSVFRIGDELYHVESQTDADGDIGLRITEYDLMVAGRMIRSEGGVIKARFPRSAVLGLRHNAVSAEPYKVELELPDDSRHSYEIPTLRMQDITIDEIFREELYFLIPFVLFRHERELARIAADPKRLDALELEMDELRARFERCAAEGRIERRYERAVLWLLDYVSGNLAGKHPEIVERVNKMRGEVLEIPYLKEWKAAEARGEARGFLQGERSGELKMLCDLVNNGLLTPLQASETAGLSLAAFNAKMAEREARPQA